MYREKTIPEFEKIQQIPETSCINLWFEDDLFCQVNFWFVVYLIQQSGQKHDIFLIRPETHDSYGFGGLNHAAFDTILRNKIPLKNANQIALLWKYYQHNVTVHLVRKMV